MKKKYRMFSYNPDGGEDTEGYIELTKTQYTMLEDLFEQLGGFYEFVLEEVVVELAFEGVLKQKQKQLQEQIERQEEKEKDEDYVQMRENIGMRLSQKLDEIDEKYKDNKDSFHYMIERTRAIAGFNNDMMMIELTYASRKMSNNFNSRKDDNKSK